MSTYSHIQMTLQKLAKRSPVAKAVFYKTGPGHYAAHDQFIGVNVPDLRKLAKELQTLHRSEIYDLLRSSINEERLLALLVLIHQYDHAKNLEKEDIYQIYMDNLKHVNNWNLVDASAHLIIGKHLFQKDKNILLILARSTDLWERRIAVVSTWYFIRNNQFDWTLKIAEILIHDSHDLIHKAVGWMLREIGKKDQPVLEQFLEQHAHQMPRTMLRYAIERFSEESRKVYMHKDKGNKLHPSSNKTAKSVR